MKVLKGLTLTALILVGSMSFIAPTQANTEPLIEASSQAPTEAPLTDLTDPAPTYTEAPSQAPTEAPVEAPTEAPSQAPTQAPTETPVEQPSQAPSQPAPVEVVEQPTAAPTAPTEADTAPVYTGAPAIQEDEAGWDCATMGNLICGPTVGVTLDQWLVDHCGNYNPSDAYAGIMRHCFFLEATELFPHFSYVESNTTQAACSNYSLPSVKYPGIVHSYTDGIPYSAGACTK